MKKLLVIILIFTNILTVALSNETSNKVFDSIILCINDELRGANFGLENLTKEKNHTTQDVDGLVGNYSFSTINTYNKINIKSSIKYYYLENIESAITFENRLIQFHRIEVSKFLTEKILRLGKLIIVIDHEEKFDGIYDYNRTISLLIYDSYINRCQ